MRSAHKAVDEIAGCGQKSRQECRSRTKKSRRECGSRTKKSVRVRVAHKVVDHGVAPERDSGQEAYPKKAVNLVKNKSKKV